MYPKTQRKAMPEQQRKLLSERDLDAEKNYASPTPADTRRSAGSSTVRRIRSASFRGHAGSMHGRSTRAKNSIDAVMAIASRTNPRSISVSDGGGAAAAWRKSTFPVIVMIMKCSR
jgi:hypothetical protein